MSLKIIGAILIVTGFGSTGFIMVTTHKRTVKLMQQLIEIFEYMECELSYRLTPLPDLFRKAVKEESVLQRFFITLADELENQISPDVACCVEAALIQINDLPQLVQNGIIAFSRSAGCFDIEGQIRGIASVRENCISLLSTYTHDQDIRLRNYQALALCAGVAVVILLL